MSVSLHIVLISMFHKNYMKKCTVWFQHTWPNLSLHIGNTSSYSFLRLASSTSEKLWMSPNVNILFVIKWCSKIALFKHYLENEPLRLIQSLGITDITYKDAFGILCQWCNHHRHVEYFRLNYIEDTCLLLCASKFRTENLFYKLFTKSVYWQWLKIAELIMERT